MEQPGQRTGGVPLRRAGTTQAPHVTQRGTVTPNVTQRGTVTPNVTQRGTGTQAPHATHRTGATQAPMAGRRGATTQAPYVTGPDMAEPLVTGRFVNVTAAVVSFVLLGTLGVWAYGQVKRDVSGVPVVRALEGPMRVAPEDPGGQVTENAGLSLNGVKAEGSAAAPSERIALAPPVAGLTDEDVPQAALQQQAVAPTLEAAPQDTASAPTEEPAEGTTHDAIARALALAEELTDGAAPLTGVEDTVAEAEVAVAPLDLGPGVARSPRPAPRPSLPKAGIVDTSAPPNQVAELERVDPGTRLVQLGAFDSPEEARAAWGRVDLAVSGILLDKSRLIQQAEAGGRTFWRLRVHGFTDLSEARRFCAAVSVAANDCIPVVAR